MGNEAHDFLPDDPQPGPSWANARWPLVGRLAQAAGTLFIQRGSGDSEQVRAAMADGGFDIRR